MTTHICYFAPFHVILPRNSIKHPLSDQVKLRSKTYYFSISVFLGVKPLELFHGCDCFVCGKLQNHEFI